MFSQLWIRINMVHRFHVNAWRAVGKAFHALFLSHVHLSRSLACIAFKTHLQALIQISHWLWNFWKTSHIEILRQPTSILSSWRNFGRRVSKLPFCDHFWRSMEWQSTSHIGILPIWTFSFFSRSIPIDLPREFRRATLRMRMQQQQAKYAKPSVSTPSRIAPMHLLLSKTRSNQTGAGTAAERGARSSVKECTHASSSSQNSFRSKGGKTEVEDKATPTAAESVGRANALLEAKAPAGSEFLRMLVQKHHQKDKRNGGIKFNIILSSFSNLTTGPDQLFHHVILFSPKIAHLHNAMWRGVVGSRTTYDILLILNGIRRNFKARRSPGVHIRRI